MPSSPEKLDKSEQARLILAQAIQERNDERGMGGAAKVAAELGCTPSLISQLSAGKYTHTAKWHKRIIEKYGHETIQCQVLGQISLERCREERERPWSMANPIRIELSRACPKCGGKP